MNITLVIHILKKILLYVFLYITTIDEFEF